LNKMDIKRYFEILELKPSASMDELNQAYKDLVNIWHPDRFSHNPRLKDKAEKKLKEVNQAYEMVRSFLSSKSGPDSNADKRSHDRTQAKSGVEREAEAADHQAGARSRTEVVVQAGTVGALNLWSYLSTRLRRLVEEQVQAFKQGAQIDPQGAKRQGQRRGGGRRKGRGSGPGRSRFTGGGKRRGGR
jgi:curved DNA-binding protein CbpA